MTVLVVDDQTNVVSGIVAGVKWNRIGVSKVLTAYNAHEAKEHISKQLVDLMLCDIEMPAESGLSLLRWARENGYKLECIFLTAHANFQYTTEAIRLGGFDYILQPARYEDIESAIGRARVKMEKEEEHQRYSSYGQLLYHKKNRVIDSVVKDWLTGKGKAPESIFRDLNMFHVGIEPSGRLYPVLFCLSGYEEGVQHWEAELIRFSLGNVLEELFGHYGQKILFSELEDSCYCMLAYESSGYLLDREGILRQLEILMELIQNRFGMILSCYVGEEYRAAEAASQVDKLKRMDRDNVGKIRGIFCLGEQNTWQEEPEYNLQFWEALLKKGEVVRVKEESTACLKRMTKNGRMNARRLKRFFYEYWQMVCSVSNSLGISAGDMFEEGGENVDFLEWDGSSEGMECFIRFTLDYMEQKLQEKRDVRDVAEEVREYIQNNIEKDISCSEIAESLYFSQDYLSRIFKKEAGISLKKYIVETKMQEARLLLQSTLLPVSMIATKVGYTNFSHFSQIYKKAYGITPTEEREKAAEDRTEK